MTSDLKIFGRSKKGSTSAFQKYIGCKKLNFSIFKSILKKHAKSTRNGQNLEKIVKITWVGSQYTNRVKYQIYVTLQNLRIPGNPSNPNKKVSQLRYFHTTHAKATGAKHPP